MSFTSNTAKNQPIEVGILEISSQNRAILEFFFSDAGKSYFKEVSLDKASAYIIDYDSLGAKESWASTFEETNKPGIIISIKEVDLPSTIWLQKPLTVKALKEAGESIKEMMLSTPEPVIAEVIETTEAIETAEQVDIADEIKEEIKEELVVEEMIEDIIEPLDEVVVNEITEEKAGLDDVVLNDVDLDENSLDFTAFDDTTLEKDTVEEVSPTAESLKKSLVEEVPFEEMIAFSDDSIIDLEAKEVTEEVTEEAVEEIQSIDTANESLEESLGTDDEFIDLIQESVEAPKEDLFNFDMPEAQKVAEVAEEVKAPEEKVEEIEDFSLELIEPEIEPEAKQDAEQNTAQEIDLEALLEDEPEVSELDTHNSASSSNFATAPSAIDIDFNLDENTETENTVVEESSTMPIDPVKNESKSEDEEVDSLLESLISGEGSGKHKKQDADEVVDSGQGKSVFPSIDIEPIELKVDEPKVKTLDVKQADVVPDADDILESSPAAVAPPKRIVDDAEINSILHGGGKPKAEKPKTAEEELQSLLEEIRQEANGSKASSAKGGSQIASKYEPTNAEERWNLICGEASITDIKKIKFFNPKNHLLSSIIENIQAAKKSKTVSRMKLSGVIIAIDPETDRIYCDKEITTEYFANMCYEPMHKDKIKVHKLDQSEIRLYRKKMDEKDEYSHSTEAFIWTVSLLTSRGRLPKKTNLKSKLGLSSWPDLTRVESIPHMIQIAALFHKNTWSLLEISKKTDIPLNNVVAFYNAAHALDVVQSNGETQGGAGNDLTSDDSQNRSFFSKLLKKISA